MEMRAGLVKARFEGYSNPRGDRRKWVVANLGSSKKSSNPTRADHKTESCFSNMLVSCIVGASAVGKFVLLHDV